MKRLVFYLTILVSGATQAQWSQLAGPLGGNMIDLERLGSGKIYSVLNQTLFESTNNGASWTKTTITTPSNFRLNDLAIDQTTGKMYTVEYYRVYTSTDGTNWTKVSADGQLDGMQRIISFGPDGFLAVSGWTGVYVSQDEGVNWTKILDDDIYDQDRLTTNAAGDLFAPTREGIKRYLYPGATGTFSPANWENVYPLPSIGNTYEVSLGIDGNGNVFAHVYYYDGVSNNVNLLLGSPSNGDVSTWTSLIRSGITETFFSGSWGRNGNGIYFMNNNGGKIYSSNSQASTNFNLTGATTTQNSTYITVTTTASLNVGDKISGAGIPNDSFIAQINDATSFWISKYATSDNTGITLTATTLTTPWTVVNSPSSNFGSNMSNIVFVSATNFVIGTDGSGIFYTTNNGSSFSQATGLIFGNGREVEVANTTGIIIYLTNYDSKGYWTSTNGGTTWSFVPLPQNVRKILKLSDGTLLLYGDRIYKSTNNGVNFTEVSTASFNLIKEHPTIAGKLYAIIDCCLFSSADGGTTWSSAITLTGMPSSGFEWLAVNEADILYILLYDNNDSKRHIYKIESDIGTKLPNAPWAELENFNPNNLFLQEDELYASSFEGIYKTSDDGAAWSVSNFSGNYVFPVTQAGHSGIAISRNGTLYVTQDDGKTFNSTTLPTSNSLISDLALDLSGNLIAATFNSPALKFTGNLTVDPATLPPFIDFDWQPTNGPYGGSAPTVIKDNSGKVWTNVSGRLYRTTTFVTWQKTPILDQNGNEQDVRDFLYDFASSTFYALTNNAIYTSITGDTWTKINSESLVGGNRMVRLSNGNIAYFTYNEGQEVYVSTNGGNTFGAPKYELDNENFDNIKATATAIFLNIFDYDVGQRRILRSADGASWNELTLPFSNLNNISADQSNLYAWNCCELWKSTDNGDNWTNISGDLTEGINFNSKVITAPNSDLFIFGYEGRILKSSNNGTNWTVVGTISGIYDILDLTWLGTRMVFGTNDGVYTSDDNGATIARNSTGITGYNFNDLRLIGNDRIVASGYSKPFVTTDFENWDAAEGLGTYVYGIIETPSGELMGWSCGQLYRSVDGGQTWTTHDSNTCLDGLFTADGINFYNRQYDKIQFSTDLSTWTDLPTFGLPATGYNQLVADSNGIIYLILNSDTGQEVYQILFGSAIKLNFITNPTSLHFINEKIIIYDRLGTIYETSDGAIWTTKPAASGDKLIITSNNYYFVPSYGGVLWLSRNEGQSWQQVGMNAPNQTFTDVVVNEFDGYAYGSVTRSVVRKSANIVIPDDGAVPTVISLFPANNDTNVNQDADLIIEFNEPVIPQPGKTLRILDVANPVVAVATINVTDGVQEDKAFRFNPTDDLDFQKTYFVVIDNGAFEDIFGNAFTGINNNATWRFTIAEEPDTQAPVISLVTIDLNLTKGTPKTIQVTVTDNKILPEDQTKIWYRGITTLEEVEFESASMAASSGSGSGSITFDVTAQESWYDEMGMEFYVETFDAAGNPQRLPSATETYDYSYIEYPTAESPAVPSGRISFGGREADYRMISIPYELSDTKVSTVFSEFGEIDNTKWRMFTYKGPADEFTENPPNFVRGIGYWINVKDSPGNVLIEGATTPSNNKTNFFTMSLKEGWNQIGNPYTVAIDWEQVRASNATVVGQAKIYDGSSYSNGTELAPFQGAFVFVQDLPSTTINLKVRFKDITSGGRKSEVIGSDLSKSNWIVPIFAGNNEVINKFGGIGMNEEANLGWDQYDDVNPPRFLSFAEIEFSNRNQGKLSLARDIVPWQEEFVWEFNTMSPGGSTMLTWDNNVISGDEDLYLFDVENQIIVDMKTNGSYTYSASESSPFKIYFGTDLESKIKPTAVSLGKPYPNPTTGTSEIKFTLPESQASYATTLEVYNSVGSRVAVLSNGNYTPGFYSAEWKGEGNTGLFFYRLTVIENGRPHSITEKVILKR
jgi:photosystem II stability/assembly factor-like uncharacterized protein